MPPPASTRSAPAIPPPDARPRRLRSRGGGWLLPEPPRLRPHADPTAGPAPPRPAGQGLARLADALDERSAVDRCRWLRLRAEAARWSGEDPGADVRGGG